MLELLLNEQNISGIWVVIGATLAFFGVIANNFFENRRLRKERQHALIREAYLGGVEYISFYVQGISSIMSKANFEFDQSMGSSTEKYYKLFLIASADVIDAFTKFSQKSTRLVLDLSMTSLKLKKCMADVESHKESYKNALETMQKISEKRKECNDKNLNSEELLGFYERQFQEAQQDFDAAMEQHGIANKIQLKTHMLLLRECTQALLEISDDMYEAIISMRYDLDRKLSARESKQIRSSINLMLEQLQSSITQYINQIEQEIGKLTDEE